MCAGSALGEVSVAAWNLHQEVDRRPENVRKTWDYLQTTIRPTVALVQEAALIPETEGGHVASQSKAGLFHGGRGLRGWVAPVPPVVTRYDKRRDPLFGIERGQDLLDGRLDRCNHHGCASALRRRFTAGSTIAYHAPSERAAAGLQPETLGRRSHVGANLRIRLSESTDDSCVWSTHTDGGVRCRRACPTLVAATVEPARCRTPWGVPARASRIDPASRASRHAPSVGRPGDRGPYSAWYSRIRVASADRSDAIFLDEPPPTRDATTAHCPFHAPRTITAAQE